MAGEVRVEPYAPVHQAGFARLVSGVLSELGFALDDRLDADLGAPEACYDAIWVALDGDRVVGSVAMRKLAGARPGMFEAELKRMYLLREYRGLGLGRSLLGLALAWARREGAVAVRLDTGADMAAAQHFYEAAGFERAGRRTEVGSNGSRCEVLYRLELSPQAPAR
jgi:ribosomal protein S18 acetylase RimI-like enzyme